MKELAYITVVLVALVMGVMWGTWLSLSRSMNTSSAELFLGIGKAMIKNLAKPMRILMPLAIISLCALSYLLFHHKDTHSLVFSLIALVSMVGVLLITLIVNVPIDLQIKEWNSDTLPDNWQGIRSHWHSYHNFRTALSLVGFAAVLVVVVVL